MTTPRRSDYDTVIADLTGRVTRIEKSLQQLSISGGLVGDVVTSLVATRVNSLPLDGSSHLSADYPKLATALGVTDVSFVVPDMSGRSFIGDDDGDRVGYFFVIYQ